MKKRLIVCFDGTWNEPEQTVTLRDGTKFIAPTNASLLFDSLEPFAAKQSLKRANLSDGSAQISLYVEGIGARESGLQKIWDGATGHGIDGRIWEGYQFLARFWEEGDEIFLFGFSRGAYTARSLAGLIRNSGLPRHPRQISQSDWSKLYGLYRDRGKKPGSDAAKKVMAECQTIFAPIKCVGVWETVGSLGIPMSQFSPFRFLNRRLLFHDTTLSSSVEFAFQALAIDERRRDFLPTLWGQQTPKPEKQTLEQAWFAGVHTNVGGGMQSHFGLSAIAFEWMKTRAEQLGLRFNPTFPAQNAQFFQPDVTKDLDDSYEGIWKFSRPLAREVCVGETPDPQPPDNKKLPTNESLHVSVRERRAKVPYSPRNLETALARKPAPQWTP